MDDVLWLFGIRIRRGTFQFLLGLLHLQIHAWKWYEFMPSPSYGLNSKTCIWKNHCSFRKILLMQYSSAKTLLQSETIFSFK